MKKRMGKLLLAGLALAGTMMAQQAQQSQLPLPPATEKELAAKAAHVTEVTLGKNMLQFAAKFMDGKDSDQAAVKQLVDGLEGIYVRSYEFDKEGEYSMADMEKLRAYFETSEWSPIVRERERKTGETTDVMVKVVNGENRGMFVFTVEPKEVTIVLILGPIKMEDLGKLRGLGGLGGLGAVAEIPGVKDKEKGKLKIKVKPGGEQ